jgi:hypothetical protein
MSLLDWATAVIVPISAIVVVLALLYITNKI